MKTHTVGDLPYFTANLPGIGGAIKTLDEDFVVEEIPRYEASGEGTHVYFMIEKRRLTTPQAVRLIARTLRRERRDIGCAGMKDARGVTRQVLSVEHIEPERVANLDVPGVRVLWTRRHTNKLKTGHLAGNRFEIRIRGHEAGALARAEAILEVLAARGVPNYYGPQRFGVRGLNAAVAEAALRGDFEAAVRFILGYPSPEENEAARGARALYESGDLEACAAAWPRGYGDEAHLTRAVLQCGGPTEMAWRRIDQKMRTLFYSALQSEVFNRVLAERIGGIDRVEAGDVAWLHRNGACFGVTDADVEQPRCTVFEISPTGPMFGAKMKHTEGRPGDREHRILEATGIARDLKRTPDNIRLDGARRPLRVPLENPTSGEGADEYGDYLQLAFSLPSGAYATSVAREVCKTP